MRLALLLALAALTGCSSIYSYRFDPENARTRQQLTERAARQDVTVRVRGEAGVPARALSVRADSTSWVDPASGDTRTVATEQLGSIALPGRSPRTLPTIALGIGSGIVAGGLLGWAAYEVGIGTDILGSSGESAAYGTAGGAVIGAFSGGVVAFERRKTHLFRVVAPSAPE